VRFDVANFLKMPEDSEVFENVLAAFTSDLLWDKTDKLQSAYLMAKLKRYNLEDVKASYSKSTMLDKDREVISSSTGKDNMNAFEAGSSSSASSSGMVPVKIEFPLAVEFSGQVTVLKSAKGVLNSPAVFVNGLGFFTFVIALCACMKLMSV
jgi:hypothetical protein